MIAAAQERLWTCADVCHFLAVSRSWVYRRVADGTLPHLRVGDHLRFAAEDVRAYVRDNSVTVTVGKREAG